MTLKEFLDSACDEIHIVEGEDTNHAEIVIIPVGGLGITNDILSPDLLSREVFLFSLGEAKTVTVYLKEDKK